MSNEFGNLLKQWRKRIKISQLDLSVQCDVSSKHLSFLETGKALPSKKMVGKLSKTLKLSEEEIQLSLQQAGLLVEQQEMQPPVEQALNKILLTHEPYPAIIFNKHLDCEWVTNGMQHLLKALNVKPQDYSSYYECLLVPDGLFSRAVNSDELICATLKQLKFKSQVMHDNEKLQNAIENLLRYKNIRSTWNNEKLFSSKVNPTMNMEIRYKNGMLSWQLVLLTLGTQRMVSVDEFVLLMLYPNDPFTQEFTETI